ncbi:uncharacterized protein LOC106467529 isoform X2 [Limulus polyphemus]|uniref:tRNA-uridine aminocarboxypropyltransferase 1 n=1 Tax=Limulus polyphemus TaxID=6850 RepID=A0ABM1T6D0_LIMPO|nr:uncharacterized protein LOC106467529 isoform X2 [Limulus polyphemus]
MSNFKKRKRPIEGSSMFTTLDEDPMSKFRVDSCEFLNHITERGVCSKCLKSRMYYCYSCGIPIDSVKDKIPQVQLPVKVDIIKHPQEVEGKSTSAHAVVLAPDFVRIFTYPDFPDYTGQRVILVFPGKNAVPLEECFRKESVKACSCLSVAEEIQNLSSQVGSLGGTKHYTVVDKASTMSSSKDDGMCTRGSVPLATDYTICKTHVNMKMCGSSKCTSCSSDNQFPCHDVERRQILSKKGCYPDDGVVSSGMDRCQHCSQTKNSQPPFDRVVFIDSSAMCLSVLTHILVLEVSTWKTPGVFGHHRSHLLFLCGTR